MSKGLHFLEQPARLRWTQFKGTPRQVTGEDIFVVRGGRISYQAILVDPAR